MTEGQLAMIGIVMVLTVLPGPDMAMVTANAMLAGQAAATRCALGISAGTFSWAVASALGVAALLAASAEAYAVVRLAGAAYLVYLGLRILLSARQPGLALVHGGDLRELHPFRDGLLSNLFNPKVGLFYSMVLPQVVRSGDSVLVVALAFAAFHVVFGLAWLSLYSRAIIRANRVLLRPRVARAIAGVSGVVLIGFGLRVAAERR